MSSVGGWKGEALQQADGDAGLHEAQRSDAADGAGTGDDHGLGQGHFA